MANTLLATANAAITLGYTEFDRNDHTDATCKQLNFGKHYSTKFSEQ